MPTLANAPASHRVAAGAAAVAVAADAPAAVAQPNLALQPRPVVAAGGGEARSIRRC